MSTSFDTEAKRFTDLFELRWLLFLLHMITAPVAHCLFKPSSHLQPTLQRVPFILPTLLGPRPHTDRVMSLIIALIKMGVMGQPTGQRTSDCH